MRKLEDRRAVDAGQWSLSEPICNIVVQWWTIGIPGRARDQWERTLFGGAYHSDGITNDHRPKYGALNLMRHPDGPSPRFGSCYFLLKQQVSHRCTFTYLDSHTNPLQKGTFVEFDDIVAALLNEAFERDFALGEKNTTPSKLVLHLLTKLGKPFEDPSSQAPSRNLNHYIEAQVHGDVLLQNDVQYLIADPSFKETETGQTLEKICGRYNIDLYYHCGFVLPVHEVPSNFRGPSMPSLAKRVTSNDLLDASMIGKAAMDLKRDPTSWSDRGSYAEVLQELKLLWHVLLKFGKPKKTPTSCS